MKFIAYWYDQDEVKVTTPPFEAANEEDARKKAYEQYNGRPPAPLLSIVKV